MGLRFCVRASSSCGEQGPLFTAVRGPLTIAASLVAEHRLQMHRLSSCGSRAQVLRGMWDLPSPGLEPVSPALAGRFLTTAPPGKPHQLAFNVSFLNWKDRAKNYQMIKESLRCEKWRLELTNRKREPEKPHWNFEDNGVILQNSNNFQPVILYQIKLSIMCLRRKITFLESKDSKMLCITRHMSAQAGHFTMHIDTL